MITAPQEPQPETQQCFVIESWVREHDWTRGCEVGVLRGRNLFYLLDRFPRLSMIAVDQWLRMEDTGEEGFETYARHDMDHYAAYVAAHAETYGGRCGVIRKTSTDAAKMIMDGTLDFVFIDACHAEAAIRADIAAWAPKIKSSGYVCGHDWQRPEVRLVIDELLPGWEQYPHKCWRIAKSNVSL